MYELYYVIVLVLSIVCFFGVIDMIHSGYVQFKNYLENRNKPKKPFDYKL